MLIGELIRQKREAAGLTQSELAAQLGVGKAIVSRWERGHKRPGVTVLRKLSAVLAIDPRELLNPGQIPKPPSPPTAKDQATELAALVGELADPMAIELLQQFRLLGHRQRQNVL